MFKILKKIFDYKKENEYLTNKINDLKFELRHALSLSEKYLALMKTQDKIQLLILRRNLYEK